MSLYEIENVLTEVSEANTTAQQALEIATASLKETQQVLNAERDIAQDNLAVMQSALIETEINGPKAGMRWIKQRLDLSGGQIETDSPWFDDPLKYRIAHGSNPVYCPVCGEPSAGSADDPVCSAHCYQARFYESLPEAAQESIDDLLPFCSNKMEAHRELRLPFNIGDHAYATDGALLIQVPRIEGLLERSNEDSPPAQGVLDLVQRLAGRSFQRIELEVAPVCPDCEGLGVHELVTEHVVYTINCQTCQGTGEGVGELLAVSPPELEGAYAARYIEQIQDLPDLEVCEDADKRTLYFRFSGGQGVLMAVSPIKTTPLTVEPPHTDTYCRLLMKDGTTRYAEAYYLRPDHSQPIWRECDTKQEIAKVTIEAWQEMPHIHHH